MVKKVPAEGKRRLAARTRVRHAAAMSTATADDLDTPYALDAAAIAGFQRNGYAKLPDVLSPAAIAHYRPQVDAAVFARASHVQPIEERNTYGKAFLQVGNLWTVDAGVRELSFSRRLARIAAGLMGCRGVRMYHDQALHKEAGGGFTPWHCDQQYWPLATPRCVTAWIPLQAVPVEMGPLQFAIGSQHLITGRDLPIGDESEAFMARTLADCPKDETPFALGEVSFHAGWTFHRAGPNRSGSLRSVMTVIYMDMDMTLAAPANPRQANDTRSWCPGVQVGEVIATHLNPVLWQTGD
jgi:ectoine hydroxylase-related dioxygenase (phytanoyl-CoA dioxygenase family)